jgi:hypothetical protein
MKKSVLLILVIFLFLLTGVVFAADVTLEWDPNTETDLAGYKVYQGVESGNYNKNWTIECGPNDVKCCTYISTDLSDGSYFWTATAFDKLGNESGFAEEISITIDTSAPGSPQSFKATIRVSKVTVETE